MAYDNLILPISVVDAAKQVMVPGANGQLTPLYQDTPAKLPQQDLITVRPDGSTFTHLMAEIAFQDLKIFFDELDIVLRLENPFIQNLFAKNAKQLAQLVRVVNYNTRSGFKGSVGSGNQLDAIMLRAEQHADPDLSVAAPFAFRTSWIRAILAAATLQFICQPDNLGANIHAALTMAATEAYALLGFANPAGASGTSTYQLQYLGVTFNIQNLDFEKATTVIGDPVIELKQPLFIYPGESGLVSVRYYRNTSDELTPIGLWIKTSTNMRTLGPAVPGVGPAS